MILASALNLDLAQPLQRSHELAAGLQFFGLGIPGLMGAKMLNLCDLPGPLSQGRHGTLSGLKVQSDGGTRSSGWKAPTRRGGMGELKFENSTTQYVEIADHPTLKLVNTFTIAFWVFITTAGGCIITKFGSGGTGDNSGIRLQTSLFVTELNGNPLSGTVSISTWQHWTLVSRSSGSLLYLNSNQVATGTAITDWFNNTGVLRIGAATESFFGSTQVAMEGSIDAIMLWNRSLSARSVRYVYDLSLQGFPGLLKRLSTWGWGQAPASAYYYQWRRRAA